MDTEIIAAIGRMRDLWPNEMVSMWVESRPQQELNFIARIGDSSDTHPSEFGHGKTPTSAVDKLIPKVGERNPAKLLDKKISELRAELAKLQAQAAPATRFESCDGKAIDPNTGLIVHA